LNNFFLKKKRTIKFKFTTTGNTVQQKIWNQIKNIKRGKTKTYKEVARKNNLSPRHVGKICGQNKILLFIPCHRVIRSDGSLGGYSSKGGVSLKRKLLNFEKLN
jgi:methylated-DNA-[protein]-cysteine S-methyltransferase